MADHAQDQILDALQATIVGAATAAAARVYTERVTEIAAASCPAILIEAGDEDILPPTSLGWPRMQERGFRLDVRCVVAVNAGYRRAAGNLAKQVEKAIAASVAAQQLGGIARGGVHLLKSTVEKDGDGEKALYAIVQTWVAGYQTRANAPDVPL
jgi:hypothetical protein